MASRIDTHPTARGPGRNSVPGPLLFRQVCLLAAMAGMLASRFPAHGLLACALLALFTLPLPERRPPSTDIRKAALFAVFFCLGFLFSRHTSLPLLSQSDYPAWVRATAVPVPPLVGEQDERFGKGVSLTGTIRENTPLAGNRVRLLLKDVTSPDNAAPLPGALVLTWRNPPPNLAVAGPGQRLTATVRIREIRGFANPGIWETERYWRDRGAYFRAWTKDDGTRNGKNPLLILDGDPSLPWKLRADLRDRTLAALAGQSAQPARSRAVPGTDEHSMSRSAAVIPALLFGDRSYCDPGLLDLVAKGTLAHSLALSGMHLGFAAAIGYGAAHLLYFLFPALFLRLPRQKAGLLLALPVCLVYLWIGGAPPSLVRAFLMLLFWGILLWLNRPKVLIDGLIWAVAVILLVTPGALFDIRLQLSAISVAGIALATPLLERLASVPHENPGLVRLAANRLIRIIASMALISVAAQAAVLPIVLDAFPGTGFWFPLNLVWLPVLGMWVMPLAFAGLLLAAAHALPAATFLFRLAQAPCEGLFLLLETMDAAGILIAPVALRPAFPAVAGYWTMLLLIPAVMAARSFSRRTLVLFCVSLVLAVAPGLLPVRMDRAALTDLPGLTNHEDAVSLRLIDVGQGQAVLLSWNCRGEQGRMLIDGGGFPASSFDVGRQVVTPVLTDNTAPRLDYVVNSHPDTDHLQGLLFPLETFAVGRAAFGPQGLAMKRTPNVKRCETILRRRNIPTEFWKAGDRVSLAPDLDLEVLHPGPEDSGASSNNASLVLRPVWRGKPLALICGDIERKGTEHLLLRGLPLEADVLVLPHHGADSGHSAALYDAVRPKLALASCGYATSTFRPSAGVQRDLEKRTIPVAATSDKGQITVTWSSALEMSVTFARE